MDCTLNFKLRKPEQDDFYNVDDFNHNWDIIDAVLYSSRGGCINVKRPPDNLTPAAGNARYLNPIDGLWYVDSEYTTPATDDTPAINAIIQYAYDNGYQGIYIPKSDGRYLIEGNDLSDTVYFYRYAGILLDNMHGFRIIMDPDTELQVKTSDKIGYVIINVRDSTDIVIKGGHLFGERDSHIGTTGEFGFGINVSICKNVCISDVKVEDCWGDGVIVQGRDGVTTAFSENIYISNVKSIRNRRQGLSIVSVKNMWVRDSYFANTTGTLPESGVDIEANLGYPPNENIFLENCIFKDNNNYDILVTNEAKNIVVRNNICLNSKYAGIGVDQVEKDGVIIEGNIIDMTDSATAKYGITFLNGNNVKAYNNVIRNIQPTSGTSSGVYIEGDVDGLEVSNNTIENCIYGIGTFGENIIESIKLNGNTIRDMGVNGIYIYTRTINSEIRGNHIRNCGQYGIFARLSGCKISDNYIEEIERSGLSGAFNTCQIIGNTFMDNGKADYAAAHPSIAIQSSQGDNFIFGNRVRNSISGHVGIRNDAEPLVGNIVSKNDLRYGSASSVLSLKPNDINDGNFTL